MSSGSDPGHRDRPGPSSFADVAEDYCELCDLPRSTCVHGQPPRPSEPKPASAPSRTSVRTTRAAAGPGGRAGAGRAVSRVTPPAALRPHIVEVLREAGGSLDAESVIQRLEERLADVLLDRDRQVAPGGEVRWHTTARTERKAMIDEGLVVGAQPGVWQLTER